MTAPYRMFQPGPMADVPYMPKAQIGPQQIALGMPSSGPAPAPRPFVDSAFAGLLNHPKSTTPWGSSIPGWGGWNNPAVHPGVNPALGGPMMDPRSLQGQHLGQSYQTPMQLSQQKAPALPFNAGLAQMGVGMLQGSRQGQSLGQMLPQIMQLMGGLRTNR